MSGGVPIAQRGPGWSYRHDDRPPSMFGEHQPGIVTPRLDHLVLAAFDGPHDVAALSAAAEPLLSPELTVTIGLGPGACDATALRPLPPFPGDALEARWSGGDLCLQVCANDPDAAWSAFERLAPSPPRWVQRGFLRRDTPRDLPRDPLGFKDGVMNLRRGRDFDRHVWVDRGDRTWMRGGTYLVVRRIAVDTGAWSALAVDEQEGVVGRVKASGAPLGARALFDPPPLWTDAIAPDAHIRAAAPKTTRTPPILRRSYAYDDGLIFLAFMRDPRRQFVPLQHHLATHDALSRFTTPVGSAVFAIPPGRSLTGGAAP